MKHAKGPGIQTYCGRVSDLVELADLPNVSCERCLSEVLRLTAATLRSVAAREPEVDVGMERVMLAAVKVAAVCALPSSPAALKASKGRADLAAVWEELERSSGALARSWGFTSYDAFESWMWAKADRGRLVLESYRPKLDVPGLPYRRYVVVINTIDDAAEWVLDCKQATELARRNPQWIGHIEVPALADLVQIVYGVPVSAAVWAAVQRALFACAQEERAQRARTKEGSRRRRGEVAHVHQVEFAGLRAEEKGKAMRMVEFCRCGAYRLATLAKGPAGKEGPVSKWVGGVVAMAQRGRK